MYIISEQKNAHFINILKTSFPQIDFEHKYTNIEEIFYPGLTISEDSIGFNKENGIEIHRKTKTLLILCDKNTRQSDKISNIMNIYNDMFHIYIENIDEIKSFIENKNEDSFDFKLYLHELFDNYQNIDYLMIYT